jgi:hypothetical protein
MGREIKRVALDFNWPLHRVWPGFINPINPPRCTACNESGYSTEAQPIVDAWYSFEDRSKQWCHNITQDEVQALIDASRLIDLTHTWTREDGWKMMSDEQLEKRYGPMKVPSAEFVNRWSKKGMGHDAINHHVCVKQRCKRLGIEMKCAYCKGKGYIFFDDDIAKRYDEWKQHEPPSGKGYQLWETVSEGSPISPVFPTVEAFEAYLIGEGYSTAAAKKFIAAEWAPSMLISDGTIYQDINAHEVTE